MLEAAPRGYPQGKARPASGLPWEALFSERAVTAGDLVAAGEAGVLGIWSGFLLSEIPAKIFSHEGAARVLAHPVDMLE